MVYYVRSHQRTVHMLVYTFSQLCCPASTSTDSLHPVVVLLAVPLIGAYTTNVHPFTMTLYGTHNSSASPPVL